ncbi:DEAD/DEAH box helicase family protein [Rhodococcus sp. MTM3W5.2]|nr:DEAD/DEAH box helicase family protein [Rhodococcus sp. MTM3W5.2]
MSQPAAAASYGQSLLDRVLAGTPRGEDPLTHVAELPARESQFTQWPPWIHPEVVDAMRGNGIPLPWTHQEAAASLAAAGQHVVVATGTASGKSLAYQLPILTALAEDPRATALYLAPTKALGPTRSGPPSR